jgi:RimJ/RimL family protein N-acetyltransferase
VERRLTNRRVPFDESWLPVTAQWLTDPELARLTMAGEFTPAAQRAWFDGLAERTDYAVWGIEHDGVRVGVMGIKSVGVDDGAEYFMYLGDRRYWGRRIAEWAFHEVVEEVRARDLTWLYGRVAKYNERSLAVDLRHGFEIVRDDGDTWWLACRLT